MARSTAVRPRSGGRTWTVLGDDHRTVAPVEQWLEAHRHSWSPNTVRSYATALAQWWTFLEQRGQTARWCEVGVPAVTAFLSWLRNDRTVEHSLAPRHDGPSAETLEARLAAVVSFYGWQEQVFGVPVAGRLMRGPRRRTPGRGLLAHLDGRVPPRRSSLCGSAVSATTLRPRCCCRRRSRRSSMPARSPIRWPGSGLATCVTGCCSRCWPGPGFSPGLGPAVELRLSRLRSSEADDQRLSGATGVVQVGRRGFICCGVRG